jgi:methyl-accepting chemotaxis protein
MDIQNSLSILCVTQLKYATDTLDLNVKSSHNEMLNINVFLVIGLIISILLSIFISSIISKPLANLLKVAKNIAKGNFEDELHTNRKDEIDELTKAFAQITTTLKFMSEDVNGLVNAAIDGKLDIRADAKKHKGEFHTGCCNFTA